MNKESSESYKKSCEEGGEEAFGGRDCDGEAGLERESTEGAEETEPEFEFEEEEAKEKAGRGSRAEEGGRE